MAVIIEMTHRHGRCGVACNRSGIENRSYGNLASSINGVGLIAPPRGREAVADSTDPPGTPPLTPAPARLLMRLECRADLARKIQAALCAGALFTGIHQRDAPPSFGRVRRD
jgi:hypothetical protein